MGDFMQGDPDGEHKAFPFSDDEPDEPELAPTATPEERLTRLQKKTERMQSALRENKKNLERIREFEERDHRRERELAELRGMVAANNNALYARQDSGKDPYEQRLDATYARQNELYNGAQAEVKAGTFTKERQDYYEAEARKVEADKMRIHTERAVAASAAAQSANSARQVWVQKYPEVYGNQQALEYATATWNQKMALREPQTPQLVEDIMEQTKTLFKLGGKPAPTASDRARMSGVPSAGGGGGRASGDISMTPELKRMAQAAYPDVDPAEAEKRWKAKTGKRLRERKVI